MQNLRQLHQLEAKKDQDRREKAQCFGKQAFESAVLAKEVVKRMNRNKRKPIPADSYRCDFCGKWHIGHRKVKHDRKT